MRHYPDLSEVHWPDWPTIPIIIYWNTSGKHNINLVVIHLLLPFPSLPSMLVSGVCLGINVIQINIEKEGKGKLASVTSIMTGIVDLGRDVSSVWSLGICFSDVILLGNQQWHLEMWALFSGYPLHSEHQCFSVQPIDFLFHKSGL